MRQTLAIVYYSKYTLDTTCSTSKHTEYCTAFTGGHHKRKLDEPHASITLTSWKKKKGTALLMTIFSISRNHYLKNKLDGKKMFIRPKLISKKPQLTFPFSAEMFRDFQAPHVLPAVPRKLFLFVFSDWCYCTH